MTHAEDVNETKINQWIEKKACVLIINTKDSSSLWTDLRLIAHVSTPTVPLVGWVACAYCTRPFRGHSSADSKGRRKNYGLSSASRHIDQCTSRKKEMAAKPQQQKNDEKNNPDQSQRPSSISPIANKTLSKFLYNKSTLPKTWQNRIKDAECKYIVAGIYF